MKKNCCSVLLVLVLSFPGVSAAMAAEAELKVGPLTCPACEYIIEQRLMHMDGVERVDVTPNEERAHVWYDSALVSPDDMVERLHESGYRARMRK